MCTHTTHPHTQILPPTSHDAHEEGGEGGEKGASLYPAACMCTHTTPPPHSDTIPNISWCLIGRVGEGGGGEGGIFVSCCMHVYSHHTTTTLRYYPQHLMVSHREGRGGGGEKGASLYPTACMCTHTTPPPHSDTIPQHPMMLTRRGRGHLYILLHACVLTPCHTLLATPLTGSRGEKGDLHPVYTSIICILRSYPSPASRIILRGGHLYT